MIQNSYKAAQSIHIKDRPLLLNVLIQLIDTPHILGKVQGQIKEVCRLIELCLLIGTREYKDTVRCATLGAKVLGHRQ